MANDKVNELLAKLQADPEALGEIAKLADEESAVRFFVDAAQKHGVDLTEDEIRATVAEEMKARAALSDAAAAKLRQVGEGDLEAVAGGSGPWCTGPWAVAYNDTDAVDSSAYPPHYYPPRG